MGVPYAEVIGDPIVHSKSPLIHNFWLRQMKLVGDYRATQVKPGELAGYLAARRADPDWRGCNVTMPYKEVIAEHLDDVDTSARRIGAVNTVLHHDNGFLIGTNTDWQGVHFALFDTEVAGKEVVLIGAGGAAKAALEELRQARPSHITILNRTEERARDLFRRFALEGETRPIAGAPVADLLINASSLGMTGQPPLELDLSSLRPGATVFDMVYHPRETALLTDARWRGLQVVDGLSMLVWQASMAFTHFFGEPPEPVQSPELRELLTK
jgi:shikimate dehydrogenase